LPFVASYRVLLYWVERYNETGLSFCARQKLHARQSRSVAIVFCMVLYGLQILWIESRDKCIIKS